MSALIMACVVLMAPGSDAGWKVVDQEDGITIKRRSGPDRQLPEFSATAEVNADVHHVLAVITDYENHSEWYPRVSEVAIMRERGDTTRAFVVSDAPWPVSDREVAVENRLVTVEPGRAYELRVRDLRLPAPEGMKDDDRVRVPHLDADYTLTRVGPDRTRVVYRVDTHPGGSIPDWLAEKASERIPRNTIESLRGRLLETEGKYDARIDEYERTTAGG